MENSKRIIKVLISWCPGAFGASSDDIPGCVATSQTLQGLFKEWTEGVEFHREGLEPEEMPECLKGEYEFSYEYTLQALLHRYSDVVTRTALSRETGISRAVLEHYMSGYRTPRPERRAQIVESLHKIGEELLAAR